MATHESSVNFQNLIRDLADMYPIDIPDVVIVELIANSLDAKATKISIDYQPKSRIIVLEDNGEGMTATQFDEYHDFAAGLKVKGKGIGFAGLGAKVSFNIADRVVTETRSRFFNGGSNWYLHSNKKLVWEEMGPTHIEKTGTRVEVHLKEKTRPSYETKEALAKLVERHFLPLLDVKLLDLYERMGIYSKNTRFFINGEMLAPFRIIEKYRLSEVREIFPEKKGKIFGYGVFGVAENEYPLAPDACGVLVCTYGKIIKEEMFNQFPGKLGARIFGVVEVPGFVDFLTTSKTDFNRKNRFKEFEQLYDPIRREFKSWLAEIGVEAAEITGTDESIELEREMKTLIDRIPELNEFFGFWTRRNLLNQQADGNVPATLSEGADMSFPDGVGSRGKGAGLSAEGQGPGQANIENESGDIRATPISRKAKRGPKIAFVEAEERVEVGWIEGNNIIINTGNPAYKKVRLNTKARRVHCIFSVACAIQRFMVTESASPDFMFIDRMMTAWGQK